MNRYMRFLWMMVWTIGLGISVAQAAPDDGITVEINKGATIRLAGSAVVVTVADVQIADVQVLTPSVISVQGRGIGQTSVTAYNEMGNEILNKTVTVTHNLSALRRLAANVMPDADLIFDSADGALIVTGHVDSPLEAENVRRIVTPFLANSSQLVNMLSIDGSDQVLLQVRVAEVSRTELKRFGINLAAAVNSMGNFAFGMVNGRPITGSTVNAISRNLEDGAISGQYNTGNASLNSVIDAMAEDNLIKVLAEPNLTTASGRTATFLAGGEFPIPVPGQDGQVTIEWREYGVSLDFTPQVLSKTKISLTVAPEVSELSQIGAIELQGFNIPALSTRRAESTVELGSGESFAIAGLLQHDTSNDVSKFPGLGDLPIIGTLFRSSEFRNDQTELVIIVTPYIVRGMNTGDATLPTDGFTPPSDAERILHGRHHHVEPEPAPPSTPGTRHTPPGAISRGYKQIAPYVPPARPEAKAEKEHPTPATLHGGIGYMIR